MPTFLTTPKMAPALAARVEASVRGRRGSPGDPASSARIVSVVRIALIVIIVGAASSIVITRRQDAQRLEQARASLLQAVRIQSASLTAEDKSALLRDQSWLLPLSGAYAGDLVDDSLRESGMFAAVLSRPAIYVHGPIDSFTSTNAIAKSTSTSTKDSLLLCLLDPPASKKESALLTKVHLAYVGGAPLEQATSNVHDLHEAEIALRVLSPAWEERVVAAKDATDLDKLRGELDRAPLEKGKAALRATLMIIAMDESALPNGASELDGERPHDVRVTIADVATSTVLLRMRKHVDPSVWSERSRSEVASGLDQCALAVDVRGSTATASKH